MELYDDFNSATLNQINLDDADNENDLYTYQIKAFLDSQRLSSETPKVAVQVFSEYGFSYKLTDNKNVVYLNITNSAEDQVWGPEEIDGKQVHADFKFTINRSESIYDSVDNTFSLQPGQFVKISIGGLSKIFKVIGSANLNDYELVTGLTPTVSFSAPATSMAISGDVLMNNGQLRLTHSLLAVPGRSMSTYLGMTYRSNYDGNSHFLGTGWSASWDKYFTKKDSGYLFHAGNGRRDFFGVTGDSLNVPAGYYVEAKISDDKSIITLTAISGTVSTYKKTGQSDVWRISSVIDRFKNEMSYNYNTVGNLESIQDDLGRFYNFYYSNTVNGVKLTSVEDFKDFSFSFGYDEQTGSLETVKLGGAPDNVEYSYSQEKNGLLLDKVNDFLHIDYDEDTEEVTSITRGDIDDVDEQIVDTFAYTGDIVHTDSNDIITNYSVSSSRHVIQTGSGASRVVNYHSSSFLPTSSSLGSLTSTNEYLHTSSAATSDRRGFERLEKVTHVDSTYSEYTYHPTSKDEFQRVATMRSPQNVTTKFEYTHKSKSDNNRYETNTVEIPDQTGNVTTTAELNKYGQIEYERGPFYEKNYNYYISDDHFKNKDDREGYLYYINTKNYQSKIEAGSTTTSNDDDTVEDSQADVTVYTGRDAYGRLISSTNMKGATTIYGYNQIGQLLEEISPPIVIDNENMLDISNPEDTRVKTYYTYDNRGIKVQTNVVNPVPTYANSKVTYGEVVTNVINTFDKAYRLKSSTTPYQSDIEGTMRENTVKFFYDNDGKGDRIKATQKPNGCYDVSLIDDAGRTQYMVESSSSKDLVEDSDIPDLALVSIYSYNLNDQLYQTKFKFSGIGNKINDTGAELREERAYKDQLLDEHITFNPYRKKEILYNGLAQPYNEKIVDINGLQLKDCSYTYYSSNGDLKTEVDDKLDIRKEYSYDTVNRKQTLPTYNDTNRFRTF